MTNEELVKAALGGDSDAMEKIYTDNVSQVYFLCLKMVKDENYASDLTHDTFVKVYTNLAQVYNYDLLSSWIMSVAANICKDFLKKSNRFPLSIDDENIDIDLLDIKEEDASVLPEDAADNAETRRLIMEIIDNLPDGQRLAVILFYYDNMSIKQIAETLECTENAVKTRLFFARKTIREKILELEENGTKIYAAVPIFPLLGNVFVSESQSSLLPVSLSSPPHFQSASANGQPSASTPANGQSSTSANGQPSEPVGSGASASAGSTSTNAGAVGGTSTVTSTVGAATGMSVASKVIIAVVSLVIVSVVTAAVFLTVNRFNNAGQPNIPVTDYSDVPSQESYQTEYSKDNSSSKQESESSSKENSSVKEDLELKHLKAQLISSKQYSGEKYDYFMEKYGSDFLFSENKEDYDTATVITICLTTDNGKRVSEVISHLPGSPNFHLYDKDGNAHETDREFYILNHGEVEIAIICAFGGYDLNSTKLSMYSDYDSDLEDECIIPFNLTPYKLDYASGKVEDGTIVKVDGRPVFFYGNYADLKGSGPRVNTGIRCDYYDEAFYFLPLDSDFITEFEENTFDIDTSAADALPPGKKCHFDSYIHYEREFLDECITHGGEGYHVRSSLFKGFVIRYIYEYGDDDPGDYTKFDSDYITNYPKNIKISYTDGDYSFSIDATCNLLS